MARPTHKELTNKIKKVRTFVKNDLVFLINQTALAVDALELDYSIENDLLEVLNELVDQTDPTHYTGSRPPQDRMRMPYPVWISLLLW